MQIKGYTAVVSGGASGLGAATAKCLAEQGANVIVLDKSAQTVHEVAKAMNVTAFVCDVTSAEECEDTFQEIANNHPALRICINCAGIAPAERIVSRDGVMPLSAFNEVISINLIGTFNVMRLAAAYIMEQEPLSDSNERGVIINTASVAAYEGQIGQTAYSASKGGIVSMTLPAAREFAKFGIRVNTIAPGLMATPLLLNMPQDVQDSLAASIPFPQRFGHPNEFAQLARHIIENPMLNGEVIRLDGALRMQAK